MKVRSRKDVKIMDSIIAECEKKSDERLIISSTKMGKSRQIVESPGSKTDDEGDIASLVVSSVHESFQADTFEDLDNQVKKYLEGKELVTISCWHDGKRHYCMLAATANLGASKEVLINGTAYRYLSKGNVSKDGQMMVQCY